MTTKRKSKLNRHENIVAFLFILLPLLGFLIFTVGSMVFSFYFSFFSFNTIKGTQRPVGLENYIMLFTDVNYAPYFRDAILNTVILLVGVPLGMISGLLLASLLNNKKIFASKLFRVLFYLPAVSSAVALNIVWRYIFNNEFGIINSLIGEQIAWLSDKMLIKVAITVKNVWASMGSTLILYLAGMMNVPKDYYEAAEIDGAGKVRQFFSITFPMITPITFYLLIVGIIGGLQSYADAQVFGAGSSGSRTIVYFIWKRGIDESMYGLASAASVMLSIVIMLITIVQFSISNRWVYEE